jgi:hypothetical protein
MRCTTLLLIVVVALVAAVNATPRFPGIRQHVLQHRRHGPQALLTPAAFVTGGAPLKQQQLQDQETTTPPTQWFTQRLNHFDGADTRTFEQRYFTNSTFFDGTGPVFVCCGGEGPGFLPSVVVSGNVHCALMIHLAQKHKALIVAVEHRYYGETKPTKTMAVDDLKWLSSQQALADLATMQTHLVQQFNLLVTPEGVWNKFVTFGGSYPGMIAGWARLKYPSQIHAAVSSSAVGSVRVLLSRSFLSSLHSPAHVMLTGNTQLHT